MNNAHDFLAPLRANYRDRAARNSNTLSERSRGPCASRGDLIETAAGGGSVDAPARAPRTAPATKKAKSDDDDGGDGDGPGLELLVAKLTERLAAMSRPALPVEIDLWDAGTIGQYLKRSTSLVRERVVCQPSFPAAIRLPNGNGQRMHPLWKAREVIDWAESHREHKTA
ncbi:hypothetical protein [Paraburkholderia sediminicola]|uniref:hypothetical protein n=1 Tax=Paraburkholderia sediminicola TaxID=458836 RepID=UPI0038B9343E